MTAIITYYNKEERTAIIGCDSLSFSHGKNESAIRDSIYSIDFI